MNVLFAASEVFPYLKTGGLGDVADSLPASLRRLGIDVRVVMPAYRSLLDKVGAVRLIGRVTVSGDRVARVLETACDDAVGVIWLVDIPDLFDRDGLPYTDESGQAWPDNAVRFAAFNQAIVAIATDKLKTGWCADVVHVNDWQTGLVPAYLTQVRGKRPRSVFTIHNIAYDCHFDRATFDELGLNPEWWSMHYGEFYGAFSMLKTGLIFSDRITTVSPTYAQEIRTPEFGYGYAPIIEACSGKLAGILNGIDDKTWDPGGDPLITDHYTFGDDVGAAKRANRKALLQAMGATSATQNSVAPLIGSVGRLVYQKGIDLLLDVMPALLAETSARFAMVGTGEPELEDRLITLAESFPDRVFCYIGYSEALAHQIEAGSDLFIMPSRYEPCGLNQMYSLRYGTPPIVRATGGLADTVVDATEASLADASANGFTFSDPTSDALDATIRRALDLFQDPEKWMKLVQSGMRADHSWDTSAAAYVTLYKQLIP